MGRGSRTPRRDREHRSSSFRPSSVTSSIPGARLAALPGAIHPFALSLADPIVEAIRDFISVAIRGRMSMDYLLDALPYPDRDENRVLGLVRALQEEGMVSHEAGQDVLDLPP